MNNIWSGNFFFGKSRLPCEEYSSESNSVEISLGIDIGQIYYCGAAYFVNEEKEYITELIPNEKGNRMSKIEKLSYDKIVDNIIKNTINHFKHQYNNIEINKIILLIPYEYKLPFRQ